MLNRTLGAKLAEYAPADALEQDNVLQELIQHYVLAALSRSGFFKEAVFHGGTCLRIVNGMNRFSEDLDFLLKQPDHGFRWHHYLESVRRDCEREGILFEIQERFKTETAVRKAFLKTESVGDVLAFDLPFERYTKRKIRIKLEVDTNPPASSAFLTHYIMFPVTAPLTIQTLTSSFSLKLHALLCRSYVKGRDWYDFIWFISHNVRPDLPLLVQALRQQGPWADCDIAVTESWIRESMEKKILSIDWSAAQQDVQRFLPRSDQEGLQFWNKEFFLQFLSRMQIQTG